MREVTFDRFYVEEQYFEEYKEIENKKSPVLKNHPEIFLLAACIGYEYSLRVPLKRPKQLTQKTAVLNLDSAIIFYDAFKVIAAENNELDEDGCLKVNTVIQEYANGGFPKLKQILGDVGTISDNLLNYIMLNVDMDKQ